MKNTNTTAAERRHHVEQMKANFAIEDMHPTAADAAMLNQYVDGHLTIEDMLAIAHQEAAKAATPQHDNSKDA